VTDESIFAAALSIPSPTERAAYLDRVCAGQPDLRRDVEGLLTAHAADNPLDRPPADLGQTGSYDAKLQDAPAAVIGERIGHYRLMEQIGEGGFGLVFVAEQSEPVRRKVALKVIKPGMDTRDVVARFEAERQALALMDHPNIAKVLDAGSTSAGRPYFVMELVRGVPITDYCDQNKLAPRARLALFVQVCHAVQHAHQKGIIHRDLKPSNVLVTSHDGVPVPKVIDFGVAKAVGQSLTEKTIYTRFTQMIGTPLYMSPEQAEMSGLDVDTRSDVYALGVLLYELLTGTTPFDRDRFRKAAFDEIRRIIREEDPPRPSTRLSSLGTTLSAVSENRKTDPAKLAGLVRGELDWIVMRCLEKDRNRRYDSANTVAKDVQRYLAGDTVEACPPTMGYRLRKTFRKHKTAASIAAGFAAVLLLGIVMTTWQAVRATDAEAAAAGQRDKAIEAREVARTQRDNAMRTSESLQRLTAEQRRTLYATSMNLAHAAWETGNPARTFELLKQWLPRAGEDDLRGFEWHYWERFAHGDLKTVQLPGFDGVNEGGHMGKLSPDGTRVAGFSANSAGSLTLKLWDTETGKEIWSVGVAADNGGRRVVEFSRDGRRLLTCRNLSPSGEGAPARGNELRVWDTASGKTIYARDNVEISFVLLATLSPDGSRLGVNNIKERGPAEAARLKVWQLEDGKEIFQYPPDQPGLVPICMGLDFSPDGKQLAAFIIDSGTPSRSRTLRLWDLESGHEVREIGMPGTLTRGVCFSPDGATLATANIDGPNDRIYLWDRAGGKQLQVLHVPTASATMTMHYPIAFAPDGKRLAVRQGAQVYLFDTKPAGEPSSLRGPQERAAGANRVLRTFRGHERRVHDVVFSGDGARLVTLDEDGVVKHWDPGLRERLPRTHLGWRAGVRAAVLPNRDGSRLAFVSSPADRDPYVRLTDGAGRVLRETAFPPGYTLGQVFSQDGRAFACFWRQHPLGTHVYKLFVWDAVSGKELCRLSPPVEQIFVTHALSPDGARIAAFAWPLFTSEAPQSAVLNVWETATGRQVLSRRIAHGRYVSYSAYSPDGRWLVYRETSVLGTDDRFIWLDAQTGEEAAVLKLRKGESTSRLRLIFSRDGRRLAIHAEDRPSPVSVWEVEPILRGEAREPVATLTGHGGEATHVEFSPDQRRILTVSDGAVKLWDAASGHEVLTLKAPGVAVRAAYFSPDGNTIWGALDEDGRLWGWDATPMAEGNTP
jgi:serine/threonine protein kinase/WD40 repeat protein